MSNQPPHTADASADALGTPIDVERLHRDLLRATAVEPHEGEEPAPKLLWVLAVVALFVGGFQLGRHWGGFGTATHVGYALPGPVVPLAPELDAGPLSGDQIYRTRCAACHQADAQGLPNSFPPLVGSEWVMGDPHTMIHILLDGLAGPVHVKGATYNGNMPAWGSMLTDDQIAAVATYVRGLSNASPVEPSMVAEVRKAGRRGEPWSESALRAVGAAEGGAP